MILFPQKNSLKNSGPVPYPLLTRKQISYKKLSIFNGLLKILLIKLSDFCGPEAYVNPG